MDCFISHSISDLGTARDLKGRLEARHVNVYLAEVSTPKGAPWRTEIRDALSRSDAVVVLDSEGARLSEWVQQEIGIALASGCPVIPVSLDGKLEELPGWLSDFNACRAKPGETLEQFLASVEDEVCNRLGSSSSKLPPNLLEPTTATDVVLKIILLDQFSGPEERVGAWSRQFGRYLKLNYGDSPVPLGVSQGVSLTVTGMIVERLVGFSSRASDNVARYVNSALGRAEAFILSSQHPREGGFGRRSSEIGIDGKRALVLDLRHTVWALRALLSIDATRLSPQISNGLEWLAQHMKKRTDADQSCWTAAPLLSLIDDPRISDMKAWMNAARSIRGAVESDLQKTFNYSVGSWVKGEQKEVRASIDNALYVLYCLKDCRSLSSELARQREVAIERLLSRSWAVDSLSPSRGLPLFDFDQPEVGSTAQLLEIMTCMKLTTHRAELVSFVAHGLDGEAMRQTFSWNLCSALVIPEFSNYTLSK